MKGIYVECEVNVSFSVLFKSEKLSFSIYATLLLSKNFSDGRKNSVT